MNSKTITEQMIIHKAGVWISQTKTRNKKRGKYHKLFIPNKNDLIKSLEEKVRSELMCDHCQREMVWNNKSKTKEKWVIITFHHKIDGYELICDICNNRRGERDIVVSERKFISASISVEMISRFYGLKKAYPNCRRGAFVEDIIRYVSDHKKDFLNYVT